MLINRKNVQTLICSLFSLCFALTVCIPAFAAVEVDPNFDVVPSIEVTSSFNAGGNLTIQPDGKIIIFGNFQNIGGVPRLGIARLNPNGTLDNSFSCTACNFRVFSVLPQPDGKVLVAGSTTDNFIGVLIRLNSDGSLDNSFTSPYSSGTHSSITLRVIQPDGKILVQSNANYAGLIAVAIHRLETNGSFDSSFTPISFGPGRTSHQFATKVQILPDGKILASGGNTGTQSFGFLRRYNSNGTPDTTFESPSLSDENFNSTVVNDFDVQPDGSVVIAGRFTSVNAVQKVNLARLLPAGNVDTSFVPPNVFNIGETAQRVEILSNGQILMNVNGSVSRLYRLNSNGGVDNSFNSPANLSVANWILDASERILLFGAFNENGTDIYRFARLNTNGSLDNTFNVATEIAGRISNIAVQPDGKIIIGGNFNKVNNTPRNRLARVNADGTLDTGFNYTGALDGTIEEIAVQPDGKILIGGIFPGFNSIFRLNPDGTLDTGFNPVIPDGQSVKAIAVQPNGKIFIGGNFNSVNAASRTGIALLNPNGTLDNGFNVTLGGSVADILVEADGKVMISGSFNGVNGFNRQNLARLNTDGSLDSTFNAGNLFTEVRRIERQSDGKYLFVTNTVSRVNSNGTADTGFQAPTLGNNTSNPAVIHSIVRQVDRSIVIGGEFTSVNNQSRSRLARLRQDGSLDTSNFTVGANNIVRALAKQLDEKILIGGQFTSIENTTRLGIARLTVNSTSVPLRVLFDYDGDGKSDVSVFRPSNGFWYRLNSANGAFFSKLYGTSSDIIAPADFDGDGKTDLAFWRAAPNDESRFFITDSSTGTERDVRFASPGDVPVVGDWDGDGKADLAVYRAASQAGGQSYFFYRPTSQPGVNFITIAWGTAEDKPVVGDFDGDGRQDAAVFRPSNGGWYILQSSNNQFRGVQFGIAEDKPAAADFDGDGKTDIAVFRPSTGSWYRINSQTNQFVAVQFGTAGDIPAAADYDGDGRADIAVFRLSNGNWYQQRSTQGFTVTQFGQNGDIPTPAAYVR